MTDAPGAAPPDAAQPDPTPAHAPRRRLLRPARRYRPPMPWPRRLARAILRAGLMMAVFLALMVGAATLLGGRPLALPVWAVAEAESRLNLALGGQGQVSLGGAEVVVTGQRTAVLRLSEVRLEPAGGGSVLLPEVEARFGLASMLRGQLVPSSVMVSGAQVALRRNADGRIELDLGGNAAAPDSLAALLQRIDAIVSEPALQTLDRIEAVALTLTLDDRRAGRVWTVGDGRLALIRTEADTVLDLGFGLQGGAGLPATAQMRFAVAHGGQGARLSARVDAVAAADLAAQSPLLAWLGVLEAPISGDLRTELGADGSVQALEGSLNIGEGALRPVPGIRPVPLKTAQIVFGWDAARARITASRLAVDSPAFRLSASAHADLTGMEDGAPDAFVSQVRFEEVLVNPEGVFAEPVRFSQGAMDLRLRLDPFSVDLGQLTMVEDGRTLAARGGVSAGADGWTVALDLDLDAIRHDRLLALWPVGLVPNTRAWLHANVQQGLLFGVKAGLRLRPGQEPRLSLGYEFADADVRFMPTLPPIQGGRGYASIDGQVYTTVVEDGRVTPPQGGDVRVARSVFRVPDINKIPADAEISLHTESSLTAALSLLDQPPFRFLGKAGMAPDLGEGRARLVTELRLPLVKALQFQDVGFTVTGTLEDVRSDRLVPGRKLVADRLDLRADPSEIRIAGPGRLGQAAFDAIWVLPLAKGQGGGSRVAGTLALDPGFAAEFLPALGKDVLTGQGRARFEVSLPPGAAPRLTLQSDLAGVGMRIADLGWTKSREARGELAAEGTLRAPVRLDRVVLQGPGLLAEGRLQLTADGGLDRLSLSRLRLADWLDAQAEVEGRGKARAPVVRLTGGSADLRRMPDGGGGAGVQGAAGARAIDVALDRVQITAGLALTGVSATVRPGRQGIEGRFEGRLNGKAPVSGQMQPGPRGTSFRVQAPDGGAALAAAGLFSKASGGVLDLALAPTGARGHYTGSIDMTGFRVRDMPALAELLNAVSIVGLIDQLATSGLAFAEAKGRFRLTPDALELTQGRAVGASFGVSLEGVYHSTEDRLDLRGVLSPFYLINGIGAVLTRPGEGLVGFTYRVRGSAASPQVTVNPLSMLAPGFFRDMFRRPAARLDVP